MERKLMSCSIPLLLLQMVLGCAQQAEAQDVQLVPRDELFAAVLGQEIGHVMTNAMNAYALGKAAREEREALRNEIAKCGDRCSPKLKRELHNEDTAQAIAKEMIDDVAMATNMPTAGANALKEFLSLDPDKETPEQKAWDDMNKKINVISTWCYTIIPRLTD